MSSNKYWGEIEQEENTFVPDVSADIERSMSKFCLAEFDNENNGSFYKEHIILQPMDPLVLHAISLNKYANDMIEVIRVAELAIESNLIPPKDVAPLIPEVPVVKKKCERNYLNFTPTDFTPHVIENPDNIPELSEVVLKEMLNKCIAVMFAHIGYETTHQSIVDLLTDVLDKFLKEIVNQIRIGLEDVSAGHFFGFPDVLERVLVNMGFGGVCGLHDFYQTRVVKYIQVLEKRCRELNNYYENLLIPKSPPVADNISKLIRVKVEEEDDDVIEVDNPQMHFSNIDGEVGFSSLETGYQLLNSLEAETNLQNLGGAEDEIINVTVSPGVTSIPEGDLNLSPYAKKQMK